MAETFDAYVQELADAIDPDTLSFTGSMRHDTDLAQIELEPAESIFHPRLHDAHRPTLEAEIDSIYIAAGAGNPYAQFLVYAAARNSVRAASTEEIDASGDPRWSKEYSLDLAEMDALVAEDEQRPTTPTETIAWLDSIIAAKELRLENQGITQAVR